MTEHAPQAKKWRIATVSLSGCFGCHTSLLDIDERLLDLLPLIEFDRSPLTDIKRCGPCDLGLIEGGVCNSENVHTLREFRQQCHVLVAMGACAINGGLPALRNPLDTEDCLRQVYCQMPGHGGAVPNDPELPLLLDQVHPINSVVRIDYFIPGCPPKADEIFRFISDFISGQTPHFTSAMVRYD